MNKTKGIKIGIAILTLVMLASLSFKSVFSAELFSAPKGSDNDRNEYVGGKFIRNGFVEDEIIVKYKGDEKPFRVIKVSGGKVLEEMGKYKKRSDIEYAEPNYIAYASMVPNDPYYSYQWHLDNATYGGINMESAWDVQTGSTKVTVAIIDTGVAYEDYSQRIGRRTYYYYQAPDLAQTCFVSGYDFVNNDSHPNDDNSHGTHVAGTVAQSTNNGIGAAGVAFNTCLMPVKVLDKYGSGAYADVADGIYFAVDNGAKVINLSLGGVSPSFALEDAVAYANANGVTVVAAAGNDGTNTITYPAAYDNYVIAVGATQYDESLAPYSNYGPGLDLVAPGGNTSLDQNGDGYSDGVLQNTFNPITRVTNDFGYWFFQGTSMAAPHVAGVAALVIANGKATMADEVRTALQETAEDLGTTGRDDTYGYGLVDAAAALAWTAGPVDNPPAVSLISPLDGAAVSGIIAIEATSTDDNGVIEVSFYIGEDLIGTDTVSPYGADWNSATVTDGAYIITARAVDTVAQTADDSISITVDNINDSPIANAGLDQTVSDADGTGLETVTLNGSASFDPDGIISSYKWTEETMVLATSAIIAYDFTVGTHTVSLFVTDDKGASANDDTVITVLANQAPIANAGSEQSAHVGDIVNFDGSDSSDSDGNIVSYDWDFGDGATGRGVLVEHIYSVVGDYTVTLTVTDNGGLMSADTAIVGVDEAPSEVTVFSDSFEVGEWNGLWAEDRQNDWFRSTQRAVDGRYSAEVDGSALDAKLTSVPIDLEGRTNASIAFFWYIESGFDSGEYLAFDVSVDGGDSWVEKARLRGNVDPENRWHSVSIDLSDISNLRIQFRGKMSGSTEDANVDMVKVIAW